jgi:hypothetical protein
MELLITVVVTILATIAVGVLAYFFTEFTKWNNRRQKLGHMASFIGESKHATIVLSGTSRQLRALLGRRPTLLDTINTIKEAKRPKSSIMKARNAWEFFKHQPRNVIFGPTVEGAAVARVYLALHDARKDFIGSIPRLAQTLRQGNGDSLHVELNPGHAFNEDLAEAPFICIGGPSVNPVSKRLIKRYRPDFKIAYPDHEVTLGGRPCCETRPGQDGILTKDYGFILSGRTSRDIPFVVLWGVYAFGTLAAARALEDLSNPDVFKYRESERLTSRNGIFLITAAKINGYQIEHDEVYPDYMNTPR